MRSAPSTRRAFLRRALGLAGATALAPGGLGLLSGCDIFGGTPDPRPDQLAGFIAATAALGGQYDAAIAAVPELAPDLTPIRDAHRAHVVALVEALGAATPPTASTPPVPAGPEQAIAALTTAEEAARDEAIRACLDATGRMAPLLGAIAAARSCHLEVLG